MALLEKEEDSGSDWISFDLNHWSFFDIPVFSPVESLDVVHLQMDL